MQQKQTFSEMVFQFDQKLSNVKIDLPDPYKIINPYSGRNKKQVLQMIQIFYHKYFNDTNKRRLILGSSPTRRVLAITGVPFEEVSKLPKRNRNFNSELSC